MNYAIISYILGWIIRVEGLFLFLPCIVALVYKEPQGSYFMVTAIVAGLIGLLMSHKRPENQTFYAREGFVTTALGWIVMSLIGAVPFYLSGEIPTMIDAWFEIVSGFTTTGASILTDVEALSHCMLFWRSFSHWLGGMGVLVFVLAILPMAGGESMYFMRAESPGPSVSKLVPKLRDSAMMLYVIYVGLLVMEFLALIVARMPVFDAICMALGTSGTGGFGVLNSSVGSYTVVQQIIITVFMMLFGVNFSFYFFLLMRKPKEAFAMEEVHWYFAIYAAAVILIAINLFMQMGWGVFESVQQSAFQVATVMTTTGYSTCDFNLWPEFSKSMLVVLMFCGACAGSTGGGMKVSRIMIYIKTIKKELGTLVHPRSVKILTMDGKRIEHTVVRSANVFLCSYALIMVFSLIVVSLDGFDFTTNFTSIVATLNNIGPGLNMVGAAGNYSAFSVLSKLVLSFDMLAGRLELFPMLLLFTPSTWRKNG